MGATKGDTDQLLARASNGDKHATERLLQQHRGRVRRMVALRMDGRLSARVDASDVVQDTFLEAARRLPEYLRTRPLPFYPWLRNIAWQQLLNLHQHHVGAQKRSVTAEEAPLQMILPDDSVVRLADRLAHSGASPSREMAREEMCDRIYGALAKLMSHDREVLVLRFLEETSLNETAAILNISENAVSMRQLRALLRLSKSLDEEGQP